MIVCPQCARDNEDHYKFCLGCGTELQKAVGPPPPPRGPVVMARAVPLPTGGRPLPPLPVPTALPVAARPAAALPVADVPVPNVPVPNVPVPNVPVATALPQATPLPPARVVVGFDDAQPFDPTVDSVPGGVPDLGPPPAFDALELPPVAVDGPPPGGEAAPLELPPAAEASPPDGRITAPPEPAAAFEDPFSAEPVARPVVAEPATLAAADAEPPTDAPRHEDPPTDRVRRVDLEDIPLSTRPPLGRADPTVVGEEPGFDLHPSLVSVVREAASRRCPACKSAVPEGFKFCGVCGSRYEPAAPAASPVVRARLVLIHPDGREGEAFELPAGECVVGREVGPTVFAEDPFLSPRHATFSSGSGRLSVRDEGSLNGVFLRLRAEIELVHRDLFRVGQQLLRFEDMRHVRPLVQPTNDGTLVFGSPARGAWGRLAALVAVDTAAHVWTLSGPQVTLGRERGDIKFPLDGFVSGTHCTISTRQGRFFLSDQGSTNGTYLRVKGEQVLGEGDLLLLGQQLFRVAIA